MILKTAKEAINFTQSLKGSIGLIPTMGALHMGHVSLIEKATKDNDHVLVSIFVNPTQFNNPEDLEKYPRDLEGDIKLLFNINSNIIVFAPESVEEVYPADTQQTVFDLGNLESVMEGKFRPGHFQGVGNVVSRLFEILSPTRSYFGEKDYQQIAVVKKTTKQMNQRVEIVACPILREETGLAFSSRNERLSKKARTEQAPLIYQTLLQAKAKLKNHVSIEEIKKDAFSSLESQPFFSPEYLEIVDEKSLMPIDEIAKGTTPRVFTAVNLEGVRLIDNLCSDLMQASS